jgi:hypothetical protein
MANIGSARPAGGFGTYLDDQGLIELMHTPFLERILEAGATSHECFESMKKTLESQYHSMTNEQRNRIEQLIAHFQPAS